MRKASEFSPFSSRADVLQPRDDEMQAGATRMVPLYGATTA